MFLKTLSSFHSFFCIYKMFRFFNPLAPVNHRVRLRVVVDDRRVVSEINVIFKILISQYDSGKLQFPHCEAN